jgi:hypothetical protein
MTQKKKQLINFIFGSAGRSLLRAEGFSCSLETRYEGIGISKLLFLIKKRRKKSAAAFFFFIKTLDPDPDWEPVPDWDSFQDWEPDPDSLEMLDPQHWTNGLFIAYPSKNELWDLPTL